MVGERRFSYEIKKEFLMDAQKISLDYIKRQAKKLKRELSISHTQALELTAKKHGYSNWINCCRVLGTQTISETILVTEYQQLSFTEWLKKHKNRNSPLGDLAADVLKDKAWPSCNLLAEYRSYLIFRNAAFDAIKALERAWKSYKTYLKRKESPALNKSKLKSPIVKKGDPRKIVYIPNVTPLPFNKRTVEKFNPGDPAWISWDGRKALPVTITKVDETNYSFKIERPLNKAGNQHFVYLDEVRSTPELACVNMVTL